MEYLTYNADSKRTAAGGGGGVRQRYHKVTEDLQGIHRTRHRGKGYSAFMQGFFPENFYRKNFDPMQIFTAGKILGVCLFRSIDRNNDDNGNDTAGGGVAVAHHRFFVLGVCDPLRVSRSRSRPALHVRDSDPAVLRSSPHPPNLWGAIIGSEYG